MANKKWKMFERVVAAIHLAEQKGATVRWNETIKGRQFDVTVRFKNGLYEYLTVVECKDYATTVPAEKVLDEIRDEITRLATTTPKKFVVSFPKGTVAIHPNLGTRVPIASFSGVYQLVTASDLKTTVGLGIDPYFDDSILQLQNEITK